MNTFITYVMPIKDDMLSLVTIKSPSNGMMPLIYINVLLSYKITVHSSVFNVFSYYKIYFLELCYTH